MFLLKSLRRSSCSKLVVFLFVCTFISPAHAGFLDKIKEVGRDIREKTGAVKDTIVHGKKAKENVDDIRAAVSYQDTDSLNQTQVYQLQLGLNARGYDVGVADGKIGSKTRQAIKQFQRDSEIESTGALSLQLLTAVQSNSPVRAKPSDAPQELTRSEWKVVQSKLNSLGFNTGKPDGIPGKNTHSALQQYLASLGEQSDASPRSALLLLTAEDKAPANQVTRSRSQNLNSGNKSSSASSDNTASSIEDANGKTIYALDLSRLTIKNGAVMLRRFAKNSAADSGLAHYGMLLDLKLKPSIDKEFEARSMHTRPSSLLCLANYLLSEKNKNKYLSDDGTVIPSYRDKRKKIQLLRFWKGDNEFANRRAHAQFIEEALPRFIAASKDMPTRIAISSNLEFGDYDFNKQEFKLRYGAVFSAKRQFNSGNVGLSAGCKAAAVLVKNTEYLAITDTVKMPAAEAEALLKTLGSERDSKIFEQITYLDLGTKTDRYNQTRYSVEPVSAELYRGKDRSERLFTIALASTDKPYGVHYLADRALATAADDVVLATEASAEQPNNATCVADCAKSLMEGLSLRRHDSMPVAADLLTALRLGYSDMDKAEVAKYMDLLAVSAWHESGAKMTAEQDDRASELVGLCMASRFLPAERRGKYITAVKSTAKPSLGNWLGSDQFEKRRSRLAFVNEEWPKLQAALPAFPADLAFVSTVRLQNYDFEQQRFPLALPSYSSLRVHASCGFKTDFRNTVRGMPETLEMDAQRAEKLLQSIENIRPGRNQKIMPEKPFLFALIQMQLSPVEVGVASYSKKTIYDASLIKVSLFLDAELTQPVHQWVIKGATAAIKNNHAKPVVKAVETAAKPVESEVNLSNKKVEPAVNFAPRTLVLLDVNLDMTLAESVAAIELSLAGSNFSKVDLDKLRRSTRLSVSPCDVKRNRISTEIRSLTQKLLKSQRQACLESAAKVGTGAALCSANGQELTPENTHSLQARREQLLGELPAECALEDDVFVAYAGYDIEYGADLKDRVVLFGAPKTKPTGRLLAMTRVLQDKSGKLDVLAKLNEAFDGNSYARSKGKGAKKLWFEDPAMQDKVVNQAPSQKQCGGGSRVGIDGRGNITDKFPHACGRFASYLGSGGRHYILLIDSDYSAGVNVQRQKAVVEHEEDAASAVKF